MYLLHATLCPPFTYPPHRCFDFNFSIIPARPILVHYPIRSFPVLGSSFFSYVTILEYGCLILFADLFALCLFCSPHAAHMHPPPQPGQMPPPGPPGAIPGPTDPTEPLDMQRMNTMYLAAKDGRMDRLEADSRGYHSVYAA